jgi:hypothetical protein
LLVKIITEHLVDINGCLKKIGLNCKQIIKGEKLCATLAATIIQCTATLGCWIASIDQKK